MSKNSREKVQSSEVKKKKKRLILKESSLKVGGAKCFAPAGVNFSKNRIKFEIQKTTFRYIIANARN